MTTKKTTGKKAVEPELVGVLAQYAGPDQLIEACEKARDAGYKDMDAYTPFPVHGIDDAIGIPRTKLPFIVLAVGLSGCAIALAMQWYMNATDTIGPFEGYKYNISSKPYFGIPANIPVTFEVTVLLSAFAAFFGMWGLNRLPRLSNPLLKSEKFRAATNDGFFLMINEQDKQFKHGDVTQQLADWGAVHTEDCIDDIDKELPPIFKTVGILVAFALLIPPVVIYRAQYAKNELPRMHVNPDMDRQYKYKEQVSAPIVSDNPLFGDLRASRPPIPGTIARGDLVGDETYESGHRGEDPAQHDHASTASAVTLVSTAAVQDAPPEPQWLTEFPEGVEVSEKLIQRGRQRFNIYCVACHGYAGDGNGRVAERAAILNITGKAAWTAPKSLHDPQVLEQPLGRIYDTITNGRGAMGPYKSQITAEDRWAIVLYVKALQRTRKFEQGDVPEDAQFESVNYIGPKPVKEPESKTDEKDAGESAEDDRTDSEKASADKTE